MDAARDADMLRKFFASSPELLFFLDAQGNILGLSEPLERLLGAGARPGASFAAQLPTEAREPLAAAFAALAAGESVAHFTCALPSEDSASAPYAFTARRGHGGGKIAGSLRSVASAEGPELRELIEEGRVLRGLYQNLTMLVWAADRSGTIVFCEGKGLAATDITPAQLRGRRFADAFSGGADAACFQRALAGEVGHSVTDAFGLAWENWYIPVRGDDGVTHVAGLALDLSEIRRAEKDLRMRIELIERQQQVIRAMSTPIIEVWDKVLTLPMVGVVDSVRAAEVMDNLLQQVSRKSARFAILDLTGVDTVDTSTASHLLKLIQALRLLGAEGIITGIQPDVAQTMVALGMNLESIVTLANLRDGLRRCMKRMQLEAKAAEAQVVATAAGSPPAEATGNTPAASPPAARGAAD